MHINPLLIPTILLGLLAFWAGYRLTGRINTPAQRVIAIGIAGVLAIPAVLLATYYLHWLDAAPWFYAFRTLPYSELSAAGAGVLAGMLPALLGRSRGFLAVSWVGMLALLLVGLCIPYAKMLLMPLHAGELREQWEDGVCLQSTVSTCGPASAATLLRALGCRISEAELAHESFSTGTGTEIWYLARALQRHGFTARYVFTPASPDHLPCPAIAGTRVGQGPGAGHFIALLAETPSGYLVGDPLSGKREIKKVDYAPYQFTGFFLVVNRK